MNRLCVTCFALTWILACGDDDDAPVPDAAMDASISDSSMTDAGPEDAEEVDAGPTCTVSLFDGSGAFSDWPEPALLVEDAETGTGFRLDPTRVDFGSFGGFSTVFDDLSALDGFGNNAPAFFRFGRAFDLEMVPSGEQTAEPSAGIGMVILRDEPRIQPVLVSSTDEDMTLLLKPMQPLPEQTWVATFITDALTEAAGGCLESSAAYAELFESPDEHTQQAIDALIELGVIEDVDELVSLSAFPVQTITDDSVAVAADIAARDFVLNSQPVCTELEDFRQCETSFDAFNYRSADGVLERNPGDPIEPSATYTLPVTIWLPKEGDGPWPTVIWGSGLGSGRGQGSEMAEFAAPEGFATIAIDPVTHGEHPDVPEGESTSVIATVIRFFTIGDLSTEPVKPLVMRDNWRQSAWDKLQLVQLLLGGIDIDGDMTPDLLTDRLAYLGVSLGGIMGSELLALSSDIRAGVLVVPGGEVSSIVSDSDMFGPIITLLRPRGTTDGDVRRFFSVLQTLIEPGDAASYAPHILRDRFDASPPPSIIAGVALDDTIVPNGASWSLMRALDIPLVGDELRAVPGIQTGPALPMSGNIDASTTAGFLQFDVISENNGQINDASHNNVPASDQGISAWFAFLNGNEDGLAIIEDPYVTTDLAHEM